MLSVFIMIENSGFQQYSITIRDRMQIFILNEKHTTLRFSEVWCAYTY